MSLVTLALGRNPLGQINNEWEAMTAIQDFSVDEVTSRGGLSADLASFLREFLHKDPAQVWVCVCVFVRACVCVCVCLCILSVGLRS